MDALAWIPTTIQVGNWVMLQKRKRNRYTNEFINTFKGRVKDFKHSETGRNITEVLIEHALENIPPCVILNIHYNAKRVCFQLENIPPCVVLNSIKCHIS